MVFARDRVRVERTAFRIVGKQGKVVEAAQDEASPTTLLYVQNTLVES